ncbi:MAG: riboflavin synthase [bacterium]
MFTGIIAEIGRVGDCFTRQGALQLTIAASEVADDLQVDDSISVSGVCLTVIERANGQFKVEAVSETLQKTKLGDVSKGSAVNLEPALRFSDRIGGHLVQGHVDGVGQVTGVQPQEGGRLLKIKIPECLLKYVISEGSIALDGVSLTVARLYENEITISLIPHTLQKTTLADLKVGNKVNIEVDLIGKYIESLMLKGKKDGLTFEKLQKMGYE